MGAVTSFVTKTMTTTVLATNTRSTGIRIQSHVSRRFFGAGPGVQPSPPGTAPAGGMAVGGGGVPQAGGGVPHAGAWAGGAAGTCGPGSVGVGSGAGLGAGSG